MDLSGGRGVNDWLAGGISRHDLPVTARIRTSSGSNLTTTPYFVALDTNVIGAYDGFASIDHPNLIRGRGLGDKEYELIPLLRRCLETGHVLHRSEERRGGEEGSSGMRGCGGG